MSPEEVAAKVAERAAKADAYAASKAALAGAPTNHDEYLQSIGRVAPTPAVTPAMVEPRLHSGERDQLRELGLDPTAGR